MSYEPGCLDLVNVTMSSQSNEMSVYLLTANSLHRCSPDPQLYEAWILND